MSDSVMLHESDSPRGSVMRRVYEFLAGTVIVLVVMIVVVMLVSQSSLFGYVFWKIDAQEIGVRLIGGVYQEVLGPGTYTDGTLFADLVPVNIQRIDFVGTDDEVLTSDLQRLGVVVSGTVARPGLGIMTSDLWTQYRLIYLDDDTLKSRMAILAQQAMKVCVGQRTFEEAAVGENRNGLTQCIDEQISALAAPFGLDVNNVSVPNVVISPAVQASLDKLTDSRNATSFARQEELRIAAETQRDLTQQQGQIVIEQGRVQEELEQRAISAALEAKALDAEKDVIAKKNENSLLEISGDLAVAEQQTLVSAENAKAAVSEEVAKATILSQNPAYALLLYYEQLSQAVSDANMIIVPEGTNPFLLFGKDGLVPTLDVTQEVVTP